MYSMNKFSKYVAIFVFINCFVIQVFATNKKRYSLPNKNNSFLWNNAYLNLDLGASIMKTSTLFKILSEDFRLEARKEKIDFNTNWGIRLLAGYDLFSLSEKKLGIETGIGYGFDRKIKNKKMASIIAESHLKIPIAITYSNLYNTSFYCLHRTIIGYEFQYIVSSKYTQTDNTIDIDESLKGNKNLKTDIPNFNPLSGTILVGDRWEFSKGVYAGITVYLPIEIFKILRSKNGFKDELNENFINKFRYLSANYIEMNLGVNTVEWLYPKQNY